MPPAILAVAAMGLLLVLRSALSTRAFATLRLDGTVALGRSSSSRRASTARAGPVLAPRSPAWPQALLLARRVPGGLLLAVGLAAFLGVALPRSTRKTLRRHRARSGGLDPATWARRGERAHEPRPRPHTWETTL